jgi:cell division septal protein FtsQ
MRKNNARLAVFLPHMRIRFDKWIIIKTIIVLAVFALVLSFYNHLKKMDFFRIKEVIVRQGNNITQEDASDFAYLKGRNIFEIDLEKEASHIAQSYPSYKKIRLIRFIPNLLFVDFLKRKPLAIIKAYRSFYIDESLTLFEMPQETEIQDLPQVWGLEKKLFGAKYASQLYCPELVLARDIIREAQANKVLKNYKLKRIDVSALSNASIFLLVPKGLSNYTKGQILAPEEEIEIKLGHENISGKLGILAALLIQVRNNLNNIKYIDLRFKEPVIKFRNPISQDY